MNKTLTGRGVLLWLAAFFGIIIATNAYYITIAVKSFSGEDEQKPYLQGVEYNDTLSRRAEQRKLGWHATMEASRLPSGKVRIAVHLVQANGTPEAQPRLTGELRHPSNEYRDRRLDLKQTAAGLYQADLANVSPGSWDVLVSSGAEDAPFEAVRRVWVP
jgi:nitrogen fixation protein FixH